MKKLILVLVVLLVLAAGGCAPPVDVEAERAAIRAAEDRYLEAAQAKDLEGVLSFYADDCSLFPPSAPIITGKEAIRAAWAEWLADPAFAMRVLPTKVEVSRAGDLAYLIGTYEFTVTDAEGNPVTDRGKYVDVWKKQPGGTWRHVVDIWNSDGSAASE
jgi:uncharacterized protein (TIGR02246 family)